MAKAFGIWARLNIIVSLICGRVLCGEFRDPSPVKLVLLLLAVIVVIGGVVPIIFAKAGMEKPQESKAVVLEMVSAAG